MIEYEKKAIIGQHKKNAITGDYEIKYLAEEDGPLLEFSSHSVAVNWLIHSGYNPDDYVIRDSIGRCFRCRNALYPSDIEGYTSQCFHCDEDFCSFEQETEEAS